MDAAKVDRRAIEPLLGKYFPEMVGKSADEWHSFLNTETGLNIDRMDPNPSAFDAWRKALAGNGLPVWGVSPARQKAIQERIEMALDAESKRRASEADELAKLRSGAPLVAVADIVK